MISKALYFHFTEELKFFYRLGARVLIILVSSDSCPLLWIDVCIHQIVTAGLQSDEARIRWRLQIKLTMQIWGFLIGWFTGCGNMGPSRPVVLLFVRTRKNTHLTCHENSPSLLYQLSLAYGLCLCSMPLISV